jgi:hypothetical protein
MNKQPKLFTVMAWTQNENGTFRLSVHHVAAFDSEDAEARIKAEEPDFLKGQLFVNTDEYIEDRGNKASSLYVTGWKDDGEVSPDVQRRWVKRSINSSVEDGDYFPAPYRRFHKWS